MSQPIEYADVRAFSQSSLKLLDFSPRQFYREEYPWVIGQTPFKALRAETDSMLLGSLVDVMLTRPKDLDKEYVTVEGAPTGQMKTFVDLYFAYEKDVTKGYTEELTPYNHAEITSRAYKGAEFKRDSLEKVTERFKTEGLLYYNSLRKTIGKTVVLAEMMIKATALVRGMLEDEFIGEVVGRIEGTVMDERGTLTQVFNQLAIYWEEHGLLFKALLDKVIVDHIKKTIQPYDIKTTGESNFMTAFGSWRYDLQGAFYTDALHYWMKQQGLEGYTILPFIFIVCFTNDRGIPPQMWSMGQYDYYAGRYGMYRPKMRQVRGYQDLIQDLLWHIKEDKWRYSKSVYKNNGVRELNYYAEPIARV